jgi:signal transduction histidine kinase
MNTFFIIIRTVFHLCLTLYRVLQMCLLYSVLMISMKGGLLLYAQSDIDLSATNGTPRSATIDSLHQLRISHRSSGRTDSSTVSILVELALRTRGTAPRESQEYLSEVQTIASRLQDARSLGKVLWLSSQFESDKRDYIRALSLCYQALPFAFSARDTLGLINIEESLALTLHHLHQHDSSLHHFQQCLRYAYRMRDSQKIGDLYVKIGWVYSSLSRYDSTLTNYMQALSIFRMSRNTFGASQAISNIAGCYQYMGRFTDALRYVTESYAIHAREQRTEYLIQDLTIIAGIFRSQKQYKKALDSLASGFALYRTTIVPPHSLLYGRLLHGTGEVFSDMQQHDSALHYFRLAVEERERKTDTIGLARSLTEYGNVVRNMGRYTEAISLYQRAIILSNTRSGEHVSIIAIANLTDCYVKLRQFALVISTGLPAIERAERIVAYAQLRTLYRALATAYSATGNQERAVFFLEKLISIKDIIAEEQTTKDIAEITAQYDLKQKDAEISTLYNQQSIQQQQRVFLIVGIIILVGVVFLLLYLFQTKLRANTEILHQQTLLQEQRNDLKKQALTLEAINQLLAEKTSALQTEQARLAQLNQQLRTLNEEKDELLDIAAHDLKTPLSGMILRAQLGSSLFERYRVLPLESMQRPFLQEKIFESYTSITDLAQTMVNLISRLLENDIKDSEALAPRLESLSVERLCTDVVESFIPLFTSKNITLTSDIQKSCFIMADPFMMRSILENLLSNAGKFSPHGTAVTISFQRYEIETIPLGIFTVQDQGPGISASDQTKLFKKYAQLSARPTSSESSSGLGLFIVRRMVESMNGQIWCESTYGNGATFKVTIPLTPASGLSTENFSTSPS